MRRIALLVVFTVSCLFHSCERKKSWLSSLEAGQDFPLYTTYAAAQERSDFILDEGYAFQYNNPALGADFITDSGGDICLGFSMNGKWVYQIADMNQAPVITSSYPDLMTYEFEPFQGIRARATFFTYSSRSALLECQVKNNTNKEAEVEVYPFMRSSGHRFHSFEKDRDNRWMSFAHEEYPDAWTRDHNLPYIDSIGNVFLLSAQADEIGSFKGETGESPVISPAVLSDDPDEKISILSFKRKLNLLPGKSENVRVARSVFPVKSDRDSVLAGAKNLLKLDIMPFVHANENLLQKVKTCEFSNEKQEALFWSNVNMMRQLFYPPQGKSDYNYYVFSREPVWGWGHGGQVFHESIVMLAYADVDPVGAMSSQRVYSQRQYPNGYINYRTGSYLDEIVEYNGELTSSAPWYSWLNWELYKKTRDRSFLKEMYASSVKFYEFYVSNRDKDGDGLCEWGGHAILESVRDSRVAVWDEVGWPSNFEALDLNCLLVMEAKSLESMALELGLESEAEKWKQDYEKRSLLINANFWDEETGFYYQINKDDHSFTFRTPNDLKRMEIIGFMPLWAGISNKDQAEKLIGHLTNPEKFWRRYGVPSLAADDSYYNDKGYWNGPVWVQWNYLIMRGLKDYGYNREAKQLVDKVTDVMVDRLSKDHNLWEFYSPDQSWGGHHKAYIWAGIINTMMNDVNSIN